MPSPKTARWLDLIAFLLHHRFPVTRDQIYESVSGYKDDWERAEDEKSRESLRRKFERDKDELRELGINIEVLELANRAGDEAAAGYRLKPGDFYLPYLQLEQDSSVPSERPYTGLQSIAVPPEDLELLDRATQRLAEHPTFPLKAAAQSARRKLEFDLPIPVKQIERVLGEVGNGESNETLEALQQAVARKVAVECSYYTIGRDSESTRIIEPHGLFFNWGHWYCVAASRGDDELRVFRVDRVTNAKLLRGTAAQFESLHEDFDIRKYVGRSAWELSEQEPQTVRVRLQFPESRWVLAQGTARAVEPITEDGGAVIEFQVNDTGPFLRYLLTFRDHVEILEPAALVDELLALREKVAQLYETNV
jgi:proteasome accessory factor B